MYTYRWWNHIQFQSQSIKNVDFRANLILGVGRKKLEFENFTKEKSRFSSFRSLPKINRSSDKLQLFFKMTVMDIC